MSDTEIIDAEIVPEHPEHEPVRSTSMALAPRERRSEVIRPLDPDQLVESFKAYQDLLPKLLDASDYQAAEADKKFVKKSGWRKIATAFDLDVTLVEETVERDPNTGRVLRAKSVMRATAPSGRTMDGDGYCTIEEFTGRRANNPKLENDLRGTAATRAKNRAISDLVGMGEVSAEEVSAGTGNAGQPFGDALPPEHNPRVGAALYMLLEVPDHPAPDVEAVVALIMADAGGYFPKIVGRALLHAEAEMRARVQAPEPDAPGGQHDQDEARADA